MPNTVRSTHAAQYSSHGDRNKAPVMPGVADVLNVVEAQNVGRKGSQASEDPGVAANATGVLAEAAVADIMLAVFDRPMLADSLSTEGGGQQELADEIGDFARCVPKAGGDVAPVDGA